MSVVLYAIVDALPRGPLGLGVSSGRLAVVRAAGARVVVERAAPAAPTPRALRAYDRVVRRIARRARAALPFRFGSSAEEASLADLLEPSRGAIAEALARVRGCVQYTLRVYGEPLPHALPNRDGGPGARWLEAKLASRRVPEIAPVAAATKALVRATRVERHDRGALLASVYHLVPRDRARAYVAAVAASARGLGRVRVERSGPFPAYAFAELA